MAREIKAELIENAITQFRVEGDVVNYERYGNGHINDTFVVVFQKNSEQTR